MHGRLYWDEYGMELLSTVDYIVSTSGSLDMSEEDLRSRIFAWSERKKKMFEGVDFNPVVEHLFSCN